MRAKLFFAVAFICAIGGSNAIAQQTAKITASGIAYLEYLPPDYTKNANKYPIVVFLHGIGERGTTSTDPATLLSSVQKVANVGLPKYVKYGAQYPFIMVSPQLKSSYGTWPANYVMDVLNHVRKYLRVNEQRIYITGLSLGGFGTWTTLGAYPEVFAAAVPICSGGNALSKACVIVAENIPLWGFHGTADNIVSYTVTTKMINAVNACTPKPSPLAKVTLFEGDDHIIWDRVYNETDALNWMLSFTHGSTTTTTSPAPEPASNTLPVVSAGPDLTVTLPATDVYIEGTASDADGSIASYKWTKIGGGSIGLTSTGGARLRVYNLVAGVYTFRLTVTDDKGATKYDDVNLTISAATNKAPVANAGADKSTTSRTVTVTGSGTDSDGKIVSYKWEKYYGPAVTLTNANTAAVTLSGMVDGKYFLRLTVTDDKGATDYDNMNVIVDGGTARLYTPSMDAEEVADYKFIGDDSNILPRNITVTDFGFLEKLKRFLLEDNASEEPAELRDGN